MRPVIVCLCDKTGIMAQPWLEAGYSAVLVDPQHDDEISFQRHAAGGWLTKIGQVIEHPATFEHIRRLIVQQNVVFVAGFPPCTDVAVSGSRWFEAKREADPHFQAKAALIAEQCRTIGQLTGAPWFFENPVSVFSSIFGKPSYTFDPADYGGYLPADDVHPLYPDKIPARDAYPKKTCLWTGNGFVMPEKKPVERLPGDFHEITKTGGKSLLTKNIRSATPRGFALAVFAANHKAANDENFTPAQIPRVG